MKRLFALSAVYIFGFSVGAWAGNIYTTTSTGSNWSSSSHWTCTPGPCTVPGNGDIIIVNNALIADINTAIGQSGPSIQNAGAMPTPALADVSGGGSLPGGAYLGYFTNVDSASKESAPSLVSNSQTLTSGDTLQFTLGALPAGVSSRKFYLTAAGGSTPTLYATGITGTTFNATNALWNNGTQAQSAAPAMPQNWAIVIGAGGSLTVATGITLTIHGDIWQENEPITVSCSSTTMFDSTTSAGTTNNHYLWWQGNIGSGHGSQAINSTGSCTSSTPWMITSNVTGGATFNILSDGNGGGEINLSAPYGYLNYCGSSTVKCFNPVYYFQGAINIVHVIFNDDGEFYFNDVGSGTTLDIEESSWKNSQGGNNFYISTGGGTATGTPIFQNDVFDVEPNLGINDTWPSGDSMTGIYFDNGWTSQFNPPLTNSLVREATLPGGPLAAVGNMSYNYFLGDYFPAAAVTGTATSATSNSGTNEGTLTDTTQSWTPGAYAAIPNNGWQVLITGGTGINQLRSIITNTSNTLEVAPTWVTTPDSTSPYEIFDGTAGIHALIASSGTYIGNIFETTYAQQGGEGHSLTTPSIANYITGQNNIVLPDATGLNGSANLSNMGSPCSGFLYTESLTHNTVFVASMSALSVGDYQGCPGMISQFKNNLMWTLSSGTLLSSVGSYKIVDAGFPTGGGTAQYIAAANADYNACWNCLTTGYYQGNGYDLNLSAQAGPHDVNLSGSTQASGPNFVDSTRGFLKWCQSLGTAGTLRSTVSTNCRASMMSVNDFTGAQTTYTPASLVTYVTAGFAPQNAALIGTASDGGTIGAVPGGTPPPPTQGNISPFWFSN